MATERLNYHTRRGIAERATVVAFDPKEAEHRAIGNVLGIELYRKYVEPDLAKAKLVPLRFFMTSDELYFSARGAKLKVDVEKELITLPNCHDALAILDDADADKLIKYHDAWGALQDERKKAFAQVKSLLTSCQTYGQLRDLWPDGERFFDPEANVPAPIVADVNKILGLP